MNRIAPVLTLVFLLIAAVHSYAQPDAKKGTGSPASQQAGSGGPGPKKLATVTGEILDMGCFSARGLRGQLHRECALKCVMSGVPMGLITADSVVYILTQNHDRAMTPGGYPPPDPFLQCKRWPATQVEITGFVWERKGVKMLEVRMAKPATIPATPAAPAQP